MRDYRNGCMLALGITIAMAIGCRGEAPSQPVAQRTTAATAAKHPSQSEPLPAQPIVLRRPAIEALPEPVAVQKKKFGETLKQAQMALEGGRLDERRVPSSQVPPELNDMTAPTLAATKPPGDALALYRSVLMIDPNNAAALHGMDAIVAALHARALASMAREDMVSAQRDADRLKLLRPGDPALPALAVALNKGWKIATLIEHAQRLEYASAQTPTRAANAIAVYRQALAMNPGSVAADAGLARIEGVYIGKALAEAEAGRYPQSDRLIAQAATVRQDSQALQDASARIVAIRQHAAAVLQARADTALASGDPDRAEQLLKQIERAAPLSAESRDLRARIVLVRNYGTFKPGQAFTEALVSAGRTPEMIVLPIGSYRMGSRDDEPDHDANETPQREIAFKHGFAMARTEVTVEQFGRFVQATHYRTDAERSGHSTVYDEVKGKFDAHDGVTWRDDYAGQRAAPQQPVMHVSWNDAEAYTIWLSKETAHLYRLPSEAEFEYALRAGSSGAYPWPGSKPPSGAGDLAGGDASPSGRHWGDAFIGYSDGYWGPAPVAHFTANAFDLFDMVGNLSEWTQDCWHDSYRRAPDDGSAWVNPGCPKRVVRGASWASSPQQARSAWRAPNDADSGSARIGFRVVRVL
jgi:formylglycine-generating enzyme required for sulfatase activity